MKILTQNLKNGRVTLLDAPVPRVTANTVLVRSKKSLVSVGTERMLHEFGKGNYFQKARSQPDKVKQVLEKIKNDGFGAAYDAVMAKLDAPLPVGNSNVGVVMKCGSNVRTLKKGNRVVSNGNHAEYISPAQNLCAPVPDAVSDDEAAFTVMGAIALQGIRLADVKIGENVVVTGLGLIGLLTVQILRANGCSVLGLDYDTNKLELARQFGAHTLHLSADADPVQYAVDFSGGYGIDAVLITASTKSNEPVAQAAKMCRKRGRIILVGVAGLELSRADFYEKELTFQVSCSYGPGRYDEVYEQKGQDYPLGFVRWTAQRNFEAVLDLMSSGRIDVKPLITKRIPFTSLDDEYAAILDDRNQLGVVIEYPDASGTTYTVRNTDEIDRKAESEVVVGVIGAGNFTSQVILPHLKKQPVRLKTIASTGGTGSAIAGRKFGFEQFTTDSDEIFHDDEINTVFITTRHDSHAPYIVKALKAGKHVFVEKPLALNRRELGTIKKEFSHASGNQLLVGFNRRFSPFALKIKELLDARSNPVSAVYVVNAGYIPPDHWTQDPEAGGGRIIGEACHFIDLLEYIIGSPVKSVRANSMNTASNQPFTGDTVSIDLSYEDGSIAAIHYFANGSGKYPKEKLTIFNEGRVLELDNFRTLRGYGFNRFRKMKTMRQRKGHTDEIATFVRRINEGGELLIPWASLERTTLAAIRATEIVYGKKGDKQQAPVQ